MRNIRRNMKLLILAAALVWLFQTPVLAAVTKNMVKDGNYFTSTVTAKGTTTCYHKFSVDSPAEMYVMAQNASGAYVNVALCNSAKKIIEYKGKARKANGIYYGLRKGTYFLKVTATGGYSIVAKYAKKPDNGNRYMKPSKTLTRNKAIAGIMSGTENYKIPDWYKITITKWKEISVFYDFRGHGRFKITIRSLDGNYMNEYPAFNLNGRLVKGFYTSSRFQIGENEWKNGIAPGTYYIGISRLGQGASLSYMIRWDYK